MRLRRTRRGADTIVRDEQLARRADFASWLAFGFVFDEAEMVELAESASADMAAWQHDGEPRWQAATRTERFDQLDVLLHAVVADSVAAVPPDRPVVVSLSGGYDVRPIAATWPYPSLDAVTYGRPGATDFDLVRLLARSHAFQLTEFDVRNLVWDHGVLVDELAGQRDRHVSPRAVVQPLLERERGAVVIAHGLMNGTLTGSFTTVNGEWATDLAVFAAHQDRFGFQEAMGEAAVVPLLPRAPHECPVPAPMQIRLASAVQRLQPCSTARREMVLPYLDSRWAGFWLNRDTAELLGRQLWMEFLAERHADWFPELQGWDRREPVRSAQRRWLSAHAPERADGDLGPARPGADLCWRSTYRDSTSFREFVDDSVARVRSRGVFHERFVDHRLRELRRGTRTGWRGLRGLVATELSLAAGFFD